MAKSNNESEPVWVEHWESSAKNTETHFFLYDTDIYVFGFNPQVVPEEKALTFLNSLGYHVKSVRDR